MALDRVLGVAGFQGSGKTTLLEAVVARLVGDGLSLVVVKHHGHGGGLALDVSGKDSDRLFRAGASVVVEGAEESLARWRPTAGGDLLGPAADRGSAPMARLAALAGRCDLVLVEGHKDGPHPKVWLLRPGEVGPPPEARAVVATLPWDGDRVDAFAALARERLQAGWAAIPRYAGILVGGSSRRMGRPKHELLVGGERLLDRIANGLGGVGAVTLLGCVAPADDEAGARPPEPWPRLPDAPGVRGPLAGILAALRWAPASWTIASCDLPRLRAEAVAWLLAERHPGRWAVLPRVGGVAQPLLAIYEPQALAMLESIAVGEAPGPSQLEGLEHVATPETPAELANCWRGVNTPEELAAL
jgi:molybdopterin-guanine dinucleotide biosynthesis protein MobB